MKIRYQVRLNRDTIGLASTMEEACQIVARWSAFMAGGDRISIKRIR